MSNDLISRKDLIRTVGMLVTDFVKTNAVARNILAWVLYDIEHVPTAFDKENVIDELSNLKVDLIDCNDLCGECIGIECDQCALEKAIKIVEKGGIE